MRMPIGKLRRGILRRVVFCGILIHVTAAAQFAQDVMPAPKNPALRSELLTMEKDDQKYRDEITDIETGNLPAEEKQKRLIPLWEKQAEADKRNMARLAEIFAQHGWPGYTLVGKDGSLAAFLILQHAELPEQRKYLPLLKDAISKGEATAAHAAYLEDRVLMREGKKQIYGTQLHRSEGMESMELWPIEDEENVDTRRARVGLGPLAEYLKKIGLEYKGPKKD